MKMPRQIPHEFAASAGRPFRQFLPSLTERLFHALVTIDIIIDNTMMIAPRTFMLFIS